MKNTGTKPETTCGFCGHQYFLAEVVQLWRDQGERSGVLGGMDLIYFECQCEAGGGMATLAADVTGRRPLV